MDEGFEKNKRWIGLGALAIIFLCVGLCMFGAMATMMFRSVPAYAPAPYTQAPAVEEGAVPPPLPYQGHGPLGMGRGGHRGGPVGLLFGFVGGLFKLGFLGLLMLLFLGLVKRIFWGGRCFAPHPPGKAWKHKAWKHKQHGWGPPWTWHEHGPPCGPEGEPADEAEAPKSADAEYEGPQE